MADNVINFDRSTSSRTVASDGGGGHDGGDMETRVAKLEAILPTLATKSDTAEVKAEVHKVDASIKTWIITTTAAVFFGVTGLFFTIYNSLNTQFATLRTSAPATTQPLPPPPIIINVPQAAQPASVQQPAAQNSPAKKH